MQGRVGLTVEDIASTYEVSLDTAYHWVLEPQWKERVSVVHQLGHIKEYDPDQVDELVREWIWLPPRETDVPKDRLLTITEIAAYTGLSRDTIQQYAGAYRGRESVLGEPDEVDGRRRLWRRDTVDVKLEGRQRRGRRKSAPKE